jgi:AcrR family transcriptional regulator
VTRMPAAQRKQQIIDVATALAGRGRDRSDVTAAKVAAACGISETMLWRLASPEFRAIRDELPGGRVADGIVTELRAALKASRAEVNRLRAIERAHGQCPSSDDVLAVVELNERLEQDNRSLRATVNELRARSAGRQGSLVQLPRRDTS